VCGQLVINKLGSARDKTSKTSNNDRHSHRTQEAERAWNSIQGVREESHQEPQGTLVVDLLGKGYSG